MMREFAGEKEVCGDMVEDGTTAAGAYGNSTDLNVFDMLHLRDGNGETFRIADAASYALDQMGEGLGFGEGYEATHTGGFEAL